MPAGKVDILMYHSISDAPGPTSIAPRTFAAQMQALADSKVPVVSLDRLANARADVPARSIVITFDDGFVDFADTAWPILRDHGFAPMVYLPSGRMGAPENWAGCHAPPRPLMGWDQIKELAADGVLFGAHSVNHPDLTALDPETLDHEVASSGREIEAQLGVPVRHFAPPYGYSTLTVRHCIARHYATSVGTRLGTVGPGADIYDLPRLEMFYFTDIARWTAHLAGNGGPYLTARRALRSVRQVARRITGGTL
ncbi:polysaccharide deacetylase family protein [Roseovarius arcticus]|uniref:polysaccharide deacetylase family protein n=1 Tax=Roseovarius arcticus TaxID=2547404 RepID=UPI001485DB2F|nr:polysaccharide deacetylase family protein [Roseovarius arcticus]